eukprot:TRINITY_DN7030_c0_g1_i2.p2 TRINITY_DN7030_c0_g1~~TRINITY_DN7030_c0_g1_i2.p2  ORF type:complete len:472 (+),score=93.75 TRINITY_DN7030_c0_g1_i2:79-1416(+)
MLSRPDSLPLSGAGAAAGGIALGDQVEVQGLQVDRGFNGQRGEVVGRQEVEGAVQLLVAFHSCQSPRALLLSNLRKVPRPPLEAPDRGVPLPASPHAPPEAAESLPQQAPRLSHSPPWRPRHRPQINPQHAADIPGVEPPPTGAVRGGSRSSSSRCSPPEARAWGSCWRTWSCSPSCPAARWSSPGARAPSGEAVSDTAQAQRAWAAAECSPAVALCFSACGRAGAAAPAAPPPLPAMFSPGAAAPRNGEAAVERGASKLEEQLAAALEEVRRLREVAAELQRRDAERERQLGALTAAVAALRGGPPPPAVTSPPRCHPPAGAGFRPSPVPAALPPQDRPTFSSPPLAPPSTALSLSPVRGARGSWGPPPSPQVRSPDPGASQSWRSRMLRQQNARSCGGPTTPSGSPQPFAVPWEQQPPTPQQQQQPQQPGLPHPAAAPQRHQL